MSAPALMTASRAKVARACRRKHHLRYTLGLQPVLEAQALRFGTLVHAGLEAWWRAVRADVQTDGWLDAALAAATGPDVDAFDLARAQVLLVGYHTRWAPTAGEYEVLGVEQQFEGQLRNPATGASSRTWRLAGKLDVVVRERATGLVKVVEHKTSSEDVSPGSDYWKRLRMDGQVSVYFEGGRLLGHQVAACVYDVLAKPGQRPSAVPVTDEHGNKVVLSAAGERVRTQQGKWRQTGDTAQGWVLQTRPETPDEFRARLAEAVAEAPDRFFARGEVVRLEAEMAEALTDVWQLGQQLREEALGQRYPRNPDACHHYGRMCPYFALCAGEASADDARLYTRSADVHPELAAEPAAPAAAHG